MIRKTILAGSLFVALVWCGNMANAASFDCAKATKPDAFAVCKSRRLSDLDVKMATLYGVRMEIPMMMGARGGAQDEQRAFLADRARCGGDDACIENAYAARIAELEQTIKAALQAYCEKIGLCG